MYELLYFYYFTHSVRCNLNKPSITQIINSRITGKFINATTKFWGHENKTGDGHEPVTSDHFSILENKLHRIKDLYRALYKMSMISMKYNRIIKYIKQNLL